MMMYPSITKSVYLICEEKEVPEPTRNAFAIIEEEEEEEDR